MIDGENRSLERRAVQGGSDELYRLGHAYLRVGQDIDAERAFACVYDLRKYPDFSMIGRRFPSLSGKCLEWEVVASGWGASFYGAIERANFVGCRIPAPYEWSSLWLLYFSGRLPSDLSCFCESLSQERGYWLAPVLGFYESRDHEGQEVFACDVYEPRLVPTTSQVGSLPSVRAGRKTHHFLFPYFFAGEQIITGVRFEKNVPLCRYIWSQSVQNVPEVVRERMCLSRPGGLLCNVHSMPEEPLQFEFQDIGRSSQVFDQLVVGVRS